MITDEYKIVNWDSKIISTEFEKPFLIFRDFALNLGI